MQESPDNCISFKDMETTAAANQELRPGAVQYANAGIRDYDQIYRPKEMASHESAREEGSKH